MQTKLIREVNQRQPLNSNFLAKVNIKSFKINQKVNNIQQINYYKRELQNFILYFIIILADANSQETQKKATKVKNLKNILFL